MNYVIRGSVKISNTLKNFVLKFFIKRKNREKILNELSECAFKSTLAERERMGFPRGLFLTSFVDDCVVVQQMLPALVIIIE